jgi:hypothetical protein
VFNKYDTTGSGKIKNCIYDPNGRRLDDTELNHIIELMDGDSAGTISLADFTKVINSSSEPVKRPPCPLLVQAPSPCMTGKTGMCLERARFVGSARARRAYRIASPLERDVKALGPI